MFDELTTKVKDPVTAALSVAKHSFEVDGNRSHQQKHHSFPWDFTGFHILNMSGWWFGRCFFSISYMG